MKVDCPSLVNRKTHEKKIDKYIKIIIAYIAWEDNDTSSNSSSNGDVEANLGHMAGQNSEVSSMNSGTSFNSENNSSVLQAFLKTHEEANKLALSNNRLKGLNN